MAIYVLIPNVGGDVTVPGYEKCFVADSFSFGVEREMKESGEKGGTEDINIGVGELQECTISKSMDTTSSLLAQFAINGNSLGTAEIFFVEVGGGGGTEGKPFCYLQYKLDRCFVKSWSTSGDADDRPTEEVAFYYNKIAFQYAATTDGKNFKPGRPMTWDNVKNKPWDSHGIVLKTS
jgi:type VI secretion system secreted protein Hcp